MQQLISVYLLEDNDGLREDTLFSLRAQGLQVEAAATPAEFFNLCQQRMPDVAVIDRMLGHGADGLDIAQHLRQHNDPARLGIVFLTALGALDEKIEGLNLGDAYLVKPVDMCELYAVICALHRRLLPAAPNAWRLCPQRLELVSPTNEVTELSHKENLALLALARNHGKLSIRRLVEAMGEDWMTYEKNRLELIFSRLRSKMRSIYPLSHNPIKSLRNEGYQLTITLLVEEALVSTI